MFCSASIIQVLPLDTRGHKFVDSSYHCCCACPPSKPVILLKSKVVFYPFSVENTAMPAVTRQLQVTVSPVFATSARIHPFSRIRRVWTQPLNESSSTFLTDVWLISVGDRICLLHLSITDDCLVVAPPTDTDFTGSTFVPTGMLNGDGESLAVWRQEVDSNTALMLSFYFGTQTVLIKKQTSKNPDLSGNTITETRSHTQSSARVLRHDIFSVSIRYRTRSHLTFGLFFTTCS